MDGRPSRGHDCCTHCQEHDRSSAHFEFDHGRNQEPPSRIGASVHGHQHGAVRGSKEARTTSKYGLRGTRVGEASNPGPPRLRRLRRGTSSNGLSPVAVSSDEEPLVRPNMGRDVLPRFGEGPIAVPFAGPVVPRPSRWLVLVTEGEHDEPTTQPASVIPTWVDAAVDEDVVAALQFDLEGGAVACSSFALPVQNRFSALDSTVRGSDEMVPTVVDGSGVEVFSMSDDAVVEVPLEPPRPRPSRRLVSIPQVGALGPFSDWQSDEFQGHSTGGRFFDGV